MLLLALWTDEDLLPLTHRDRPRRRAFHGIRLNPPTPITRHDSHLDPTAQSGRAPAEGGSEAHVARNWINEVQRAPKEQGKPPFRRRSRRAPPEWSTARRSGLRRRTDPSARPELGGEGEGVGAQDRLQLGVEPVAGVDRELAA